MARQRRARYLTGKERGAAIVEFVRASRTYWSQEEGLAPFLVIDLMLPEWKTSVFGTTLVSPFGLLENALRRNPDRRQRSTPTRRVDARAKKTSISRVLIRGTLGACSEEAERLAQRVPSVKEI